MLPKPDFTQLVEVHSREIYTFLWRMLQDTKDAEDCLQDTYLRAFKAYGRLNHDSNYRAWLYKIATNYTYTALKRGQRQAAYGIPLLEETHQAPADAGQSPDRRAVLDETWATVRQAIIGLPTKQRTALILRHVQGLDYAEIALALGCSEDSARANVYQAVRRLRRELGTTVAEALAE